MACEIFMLNSSSNELGIIKFLSTSVFSGETFSFFSQRLSLLSPSKSSAKDSSVPILSVWHRPQKASSWELLSAVAAAAVLPVTHKSVRSTSTRLFMGKGGVSTAQMRRKPQWQCVCRSWALQVPQLLLVTPAMFCTRIAKKQWRTIVINIFSCWDKYPLFKNPHLYVHLRNTPNHCNMGTQMLWLI